MSRFTLQLPRLIPLIYRSCVIRKLPHRFLPFGPALIPFVLGLRKEVYILYRVAGVIGLTSDRRICVGRHMANNSVFVNVATVLWAANISAVKDDAGKPIIPNTLESVNAALCEHDALSLFPKRFLTRPLSSRHPLPFDCEITPRFPGVTNVISQTRELLE